MYVGTRIPISMTSQRMQVIVISAKSRDIKHIIVGVGLSEHQDLMVTTITTISMVIELLSADQSLCGHQISMQKEATMHTNTIGTTT